jgi:hypothetical protein
MQALAGPTRLKGPAENPHGPTPPLCPGFSAHPCGALPLLDPVVAVPLTLEPAVALPLEPPLDEPLAVDPLLMVPLVEPLPTEPLAEPLLWEPLLTAPLLSPLDGVGPPVVMPPQASMGGLSEIRTAR